MLSAWPTTALLAHANTHFSCCSFFGKRQEGAPEEAAPAAASAAADRSSLRYTGEGGRFAAPAAGGSAASAGAASGLGGDGEDGADEELEPLLDEEAAGDAMRVALPDQLDEAEEFDLMSKLSGLRQSSRR